MNNISLPIGIEKFAELRQTNRYYVDKTEFISKLIEDSFKVNLITRPRRFGKTLTMTMLEDFLSIRTDSTADFKGLRISNNEALCAQWQNKWPVVFFSFKDFDGTTFEASFRALKSSLANLFSDFKFLLTSALVEPEDKAIFNKILAQEGNDIAVKESFRLLSKMLHGYYAKPIILLIDEYDVPLSVATENDYYKDVLDIIRGMYIRALKGNDSLKFAVLTGCLKIAKESIFTGTNNMFIDSITSDRFDEYIGFTQVDVDTLLKDLDMDNKATIIKKWYDGYRFGRVEVYCPWDVLSYAADLKTNPEKLPQNYWRNTSHNGVIYKFINRQDLYVNDKFDVLMSGGSIKTKLMDDMTYDTLESSEENLWNLLFMTGYLTKDISNDDKQGDTDDIYLKIPNEEIKGIFAKAIITWFDKAVKTIDREPLFKALWQGKAVDATSFINEILMNTISYYDYKEDYYHAFLVGLLSGRYKVSSNDESGLGRPDLIVKMPWKADTLVIEIKVAKSKAEMQVKCAEALRQIKDRRYLEGLSEVNRENAICYGIAFFGKECLIEKE